MTAMEPDPKNHAQTSGWRAHRAEYVRWLVLALLLLATALVTWRLLNLLLLIFGAILVAILLRAVADWMAKFAGVPQGWNLTAALFGLLGLVALVAWLFGAPVHSQLAGLSTTLPEAWRALEAEIRETQAGQQLLYWIRTAAFGSATSRDLAQLAISLTNGVGSLIVIVVGGTYFAAQPQLYYRGALLLLPHKVRDAGAEVMNKTFKALKLWLVGQLAIMVIVGTLTGLGAWIIGLPSALALGLIAGFLEFIPFLGPVLTAVPALLLALAIGPQTALWTLLLLVLVQQTEGNIITPLIQRKAVTLPPALTLFALIAMGLLFGPLGILLSAPLTAVAYVMVGELYIRRGLGEQTELSEKIDTLPRQDRDGGQ